MDARRAVWNAGWLMAQRVGHMAGAAVFAVTVPRVMGPTLFGRFALLTSISLWFALLSGLGAVSMFARSIPRFLANDDMPGVRALASSILVLRLLTGSASAVTYFLLVTLVIKEPDVAASACVAAVVLCRTAANLCFALFLGHNRAALWGLGELLRRWFSLAGVPIGFMVGGLRGACLGLLGAELVVLACGFWWARPYFDWSRVDLSRQHLQPYVRMGTVFAVSGLLLALTQRSGETLVRFATGRYEEVAYFGAAYAIYLTLAHALGQMGGAFGPFLVSLMARGRHDDVAMWLGQLLKLTMIAAVMAAAGMLLVGRDLVPLVLGERYLRVVPNLTPLMLALVPAAVGGIARSLALALDRPQEMAWAAATEFGLFWGLGFALASAIGSLGAAWAALPASLCYGGILVVRCRRLFPFPMRAAGKAVALSVVFVALGWFRSHWIANGLLFLTGAAVYVVLLLRANVVTMAELRSWREFLSGSQQAAVEDA